jgi:hypothetical protein
MASDQAALISRARRAYETGRVAAALPTTALVAPMAALSFFCCGRREATACLATALALLVTALLWRGRDLGRSVRAGLAAGAAPLLLPLLAMPLGHVCPREACLVFPVACVVGGVVAGVVLAASWRRAGTPRRTRALVAGFAVAALAGSLGCLIAGALGVLGMAAGLALGGAPVLALPSPQRP